MKSSLKLAEYFKIPVILVIILGIYGCTQPEYLTVLDLSDLEHPEFCLSSKENCRGHGITYGNFSISEEKIINQKHELKNVWSLEANKDYAEIKNFKYGVVPPGYKEIVKAKPLKINTLYSFGRGINITFYKEDGKYIAHQP